MILGPLLVTFFSQIERHEVCCNMICHWRKTGCQEDDTTNQGRKEREGGREDGEISSDKK
jgi:hypothetical protein